MKKVWQKERGQHRTRCVCNFHQVLLNKVDCALDYETQRLMKHLPIGQFQMLFNTNML